jgi:hypothetical protein
MDRHVVGLIALDQVLRFSGGSVVDIAFVAVVGGKSLQNYPAHSSCFGIPFNMVAALECFPNESAADIFWSGRHCSKPLTLISGRAFSSVLRPRMF